MTTKTTATKPKLWNPDITTALCVNCGQDETKHGKIGVYPVYCPKARA